MKTFQLSGEVCLLIPYAATLQKLKYFVPFTADLLVYTQVQFRHVLIVMFASSLTNFPKYLFNYQCFSMSDITW